CHGETLVKPAHRLDDLRQTARPAGHPVKEHPNLVGGHGRGGLLYVSRDVSNDSHGGEVELAFVQRGDAARHCRPAGELARSDVAPGPAVVSASQSPPPGASAAARFAVLM